MSVETQKESSLKKWIGKLHLWLGLTSGLLVFIIAITGCIYAFQSEIQDLTQPYRFVEPKNSATILPPSRLKSIAEGVLPGKHIHAVLYGKEGRAAQVIFFQFEPEYYYDIIYLNPYTGQVLFNKDVSKSFFQIVLNGHFYLWLPPAIGQPVAATATLVFVIMLISGLILWWPRNKNGKRQRFTIRWNAKWRRKNYDLHNVFGFYVMIIALILALTGLVWGFQWFAQAVYAAAGGEKSLTYADPVSDTTSYYKSSSAIDHVWHKLRTENPGAEMVEIHIPESKNSSIAASVNNDETTYWKTDYRYFDQYTLKELKVDHVYDRLETASAADKLIRMNYDIHTGAIIGFPGKIIAFLASLVCASLPITGFLIWWGRKNKQKRKETKTVKKHKALAETIL